MAGFSMDVIGLAEVMGKLGVMERDAEVKAEFLKSRQQMRISGLEGELYNDAIYSRWECFGHHTRSGSWVAGQDFMTAPILVGQKSLESRLGHIFF